MHIDEYHIRVNAAIEDETIEKAVADTILEMINT